MRLIRWFLAVVLLMGLVATLFFVLNRSAPTVPFARATRGALTSALLTNGQVEPLDGVEIRASASGRVTEVLAAQGQMVSAGTLLLRQEDPGIRSELRDAQSALSAADARLRQAAGGGSPLRRKELEGLLQQARLNLRHAQEEEARISRLVQANAATPRELETEQRQVSIAKERVDAFEAQLRVLFSDADLEDARAAVSAAQARLEAVNRRSSDTRLSSPATGTLFEFSARQGAWFQPGDLIGRLGNLEILRVRVFVDEPELGRVREGMPVSIRWDGLPGSVWKGHVDRLPTRIETFGTRQVGEVICRIQNPSRDLLPGANVNAEVITAQEVEAVLVPKQAIRRRLGEEGVWKLSGSTIRWQPVRVGISSITEAQIVNGVSEGDSVALLVDRELQDGMEVQPQYP